MFFDFSSVEIRLEHFIKSGGNDQNRNHVPAKYEPKIRTYFAIKVRVFNGPVQIKTANVVELKLHRVGNHMPPTQVLIRIIVCLNVG